MRKSRKSCGVELVASGLAVSGTAASKATTVKAPGKAPGKTPDMIAYIISRKEIMQRARKGIETAKPPHSGCSRRTRAATAGLTIIQNAPILRKTLRQKSTSPKSTTQEPQEASCGEIVGAQYITFLCDIKMSDIPDSIIKASMALDQDNLYAFRKSLNSNRLSATSSALDIFTNWLKHSIKRNPRARALKKIMVMPLISQLALSRMFVIRIILDMANKSNRQTPSKIACKTARKTARGTGIARGITRVAKRK